MMTFAGILIGIGIILIALMGVDSYKRVKARVARAEAKRIEQNARFVSWVNEIETWQKLQKTQEEQGFYGLGFINPAEAQARGGATATATEAMKHDAELALLGFHNDAKIALGLAIPKELLDDKRSEPSGPVLLDEKPTRKIKPNK